MTNNLNQKMKNLRQTNINNQKQIKKIQMHNLDTFLVLQVLKQCQSFLESKQKSIEKF
ncbi:unnamed protein product [Paramecium sonneborni]|uniref:Uncharacterized protein n=1 Tax=Paramecium sonneborni TaxID=65129 RepID=A0A8S1R1N0_9CILI|nr:unnamed protein product [Paramecium sonneborni]